LHKKIPKPKIYDWVERADFSKISGYVKKILNNKEVLVYWSDTGKTTKEKIKNLALVKR